MMLLSLFARIYILIFYPLKSAIIEEVAKIEEMKKIEEPIARASVRVKAPPG